ncbi:MAG: hypothetical protein ACOWW1_10585 [archaeon]
MKKFASLFILMFYVAVVSVSFQQIRPMKADDYIYIRENGSS